MNVILIGISSIILSFTSIDLAHSKEETVDCMYQKLYTSAIFGALDDSIANKVDIDVTKYLEYDLSIAIELERNECDYE